MIRRTFGLVGVVMAAMLVMGPAAAAGPAIQKNDLVVAVDDAPCGAFTYDLALLGRQTVKDFGDRVTIHENWHGDAVASNGTSLRVHHALTLELDLVAGTGTFTGLGFGTWADGSSVKHLFRGRLVVDLATFDTIFAAGNHPDSLAEFDPHQLTCDLIAAAS